MWPEWFWMTLVILAFFAGMGAMWLIEREIANEREAVLCDALFWSLAYLEQGVDSRDSDYFMTVGMVQAALALVDDKDGG